MAIGGVEHTFRIPQDEKEVVIQELEVLDRSCSQGQAANLG